MMSIRPRHSCNILNLIKLWEIRKLFPSDYVGWVYIYVTKDKNLLRKVVEYDESSMTWYQPHYEIINDKNCDFDILNGKVVARFWCDRVDEIFAKPDRCKEFYFYDTSKLDTEDLLKQSCLEYDELDVYLDANNGYAIHITKLETFDKPKEISEFKHLTCRNCKTQFIRPLTRAPESWCYVEV